MKLNEIFLQNRNKHKQFFKKKDYYNFFFYHCEPYLTVLDVCGVVYLRIYCRHSIVSRAGQHGSLCQRIGHMGQETLWNARTALNTWLRWTFL